jgi:hypothetical protein
MTEETRYSVHPYVHNLMMELAEQGVTYETVFGVTDTDYEIDYGTFADVELAEKVADMLAKRTGNYFVVYATPHFKGAAK